MNQGVFSSNNSKKYISTKEASGKTGYSKDYIGQLARGNKIDCKKIGRVWYVGEESVLGYKDVTAELKSLTASVAVAKNSPLEIPPRLEPPYSPLSGGNHLPPLIRGGQEGLEGVGGEVSKISEIYYKRERKDFLKLKELLTLTFGFTVVAGMMYGSGLNSLDALKNIFSPFSPAGEFLAANSIDSLRDSFGNYVSGETPGDGDSEAILAGNVTQNDLLNAFKNYVKPPASLTTVPPLGKTKTASLGAGSKAISSSLVSKEYLVSAIKDVLSQKEFAALLRGPQGAPGAPGPAGPKGDTPVVEVPGTSSRFLSYAPVTIIQPSSPGSSNFAGATIISATDLSSSKFITDTGKITTLTVTGTATFSGAATIPTLTATTSTTDTLTVGGGYGSTGVSISALGNIEANGTLTIDGASTLTGSTILGSAASSTNTIGSTTTPGALTLHGATTLDNNFSQTGANTFSTGTGAISLNGATSVTGTNTLTVGTGLTTLGGNLTVSGATTSLASTAINLTGASPIIDLTSATTLGINTTTNRPITTGTGLFTTGGSATIAGTTGVTLSGVGAGITFSGTGNHDITASSGTLRIGANTVIGQVLPLDNTIDIGSVAQPFDKIYAQEVNATTLVGTITGGNSSAETFTINSDNATLDAEDSYLRFHRGSTSPHALFNWDSTNDEYDFNSSLHITGTIKTDPYIIFDSSVASDTDYWLGVQEDAGGDDDDKFQIGDGATPGTNPFLTIDTSGNVGIGTTGPSAKLHVATAPVASANSGTISLGSGAFDGSTSGYFVGSALGTSLAVNEASAFTGDLINLQRAGGSKFKVDYWGNANVYTTDTGNVNSFTVTRDVGEARLTIMSQNDSAVHNTADNYPYFQMIRNNYYGAAYRPMVTADLLGRIGVRAPQNSSGTYNGDGALGIDFFATEDWTTSAAGSRMAFHATSRGTTSTYFPLDLNNSYNFSAAVAAVGDGTISNIFEARTTASGSVVFNIGKNGGVGATSTGAVTAASYGLNLSNSTTNATTDAVNKYGAYITSTGAWTGSSGTATNNYGLYVDTVSGADNNYGAYIAGNVGIGTATPTAHLQIDGNISATAWTTDGIAFDSNAATFTDTSTAALGTVAVRGANSFGIPTFASTNAITVTDAAALYLAGAAAAGTNTTITNAWALYGAAGNWKQASTTASTSSTTGALVVSGGVGVATAVTTATSMGLNVAHTGAITGTGYGGYFSKTGVSTTNVGLYATASGATNNYAAIFEAGNVGIGTTTPGLDVVGTTDLTTGKVLDVRSSSGGADIYINGDPARLGMIDSAGGADDKWSVLETNGGVIEFYSVTDGGALRTDNILVMDLGNGNVGIGATSPTAHLQIDGNISAAAWTTDGIAFDSNAATYTDTSTAALGTVAVRGANSFGIPTFASTNAITVTDAAALYLAGAAAAGTNTTITNAWALYGAAGNWKQASTTASTSTTTGALVVSGGVGIATATTTASSMGLNVAHTGAITGTGYGGYFSKTGASTTNVGLYATASGATNNYAAIFEAGNVGIGDTSPDSLLDILSATTGTDIIITNTNASDTDVTVGFALVDGTNNFTLGVDDSATGDPFKISTTALGTGDFLTLDSRTTTSGVSATNFAAAAPTIASGASTFFNIFSITPGTVNFSGSTQITSTGTSANNALLFNQPTINRTDAATSLTIDQASNLFINGPTIASHATVGQTETITVSAALRIGAGATVAGTRGVVTNAYGLYVDQPIGATNNYAATFTGGNVGIGTTNPGAKLEIVDTSKVTDSYGNLSIRTSDVQAIDKGAQITLSGTINDLGTSISDFATIAGRKENGSSGNFAGYLAFGTIPDSPNVNVERMRITSTGNVGIGTTEPNGILHLQSATVNKEMLIIRNTNTTASASVPLFLASNSGGSLTNVSIENGGAGNMTFRTGATTEAGYGTAQMTILSGGNVGIGTTSPTGNLAITQTAAATGALKGIVYTGAVNTNQTLSTEIPAVTFTTAGRQWATGALTTQREVLITQPTYSFVGASTITDAATVGIAGAPQSSTNATITNSHGLLIQAGAVQPAGAVTNSYGLTVNAQTGATNNYGAVFATGNVGIGTTSPTAHLQIDGNISATAWTTDGIAFDSNAATFTDTSTAALGTVAVRTANSFGAPTFASTNAITVTDAFTLYVPKPIAGTNTTITRANSAYFEGSVGIGTTGPKAGFQIGKSFVAGGDAAFSLANNSTYWGANFYYSSGWKRQLANIDSFQMVTYGGAAGSTSFLVADGTGAAADSAITFISAMDFLSSNGNIGIRTAVPDAALEINHATGDSLRLTYNDSNGSATNFSDFSLSSTGALTITGSAASVASAATAEKTFFTLTPATITLTGTTQVTSLMDTYLFSRATIAGDTATVTVDDAATLTIEGPPAEGTNVALTEAYGLKINTASSTAATTYGFYVDAPTGGTTANYGAIFASGNVGIGTTAPGALLQVSNSANALREIQIENANAGTAAQAVIGLANGGGRGGALAITGQSYTSVVTWDRQDGVYLQAETTSAGGLSLAARATTGGIITLHTGGNSERVRIDEAGNVGIGTTGPAGLLHVSSDTVDLGKGYFTQANASADSFDFNFRKARGTGAVPTVITTADELGVINFTGYGGAAGYIAGAAIKGISSGTIADSRVPGQLSFWTGTDAAPSVLTERMKIDNAGGIFFPAEAGANSNDYLCIDVTGGAISSKATACTGSSSLRYKKNIEDLNLGLDAVLQMRPVAFDWKLEYIKNPNAPRQIGFIAEEMAAISPLFVTYENGQVEGVEYMKLTAVLAGAIQELNLTLEGIEERIAALEAAGGLSLGSGSSSGLLDTIKNWLADAGNGITNIFTGTLHVTNELCIGATCINEAELQAILQNTGVSNSSPSPSPGEGGGEVNSAGSSTTPSSTSPNPPLTGEGGSDSTTGAGEVSGGGSETTTTSNQDTGVSGTGQATDTTAGTESTTETTQPSSETTAGEATTTESTAASTESSGEPMPAPTPEPAPAPAE